MHALKKKTKVRSHQVNDEPTTVHKPTLYTITGVGLCERLDNTFKRTLYQVTRTEREDGWYTTSYVNVMGVVIHSHAIRHGRRHAWYVGHLLRGDEDERELALDGSLFGPQV